MGAPLSEVAGKRLALMLLYPGEGREESVIFSGTAKVQGPALLLDRGEKGFPLRVPDDALEFLSRTGPQLLGVLRESQYWVIVKLGAVPPGTDPAERLR